MVSPDSAFDGKILTLDSMNPYIKAMEYALEDPMHSKARELKNELKKGPEIIRAHVGDSQAMDPVPITFIRQVFALVSMPELGNDDRFPKDVKHRAKEILGACRGGSIGSYTDSLGLELIRKHCAEYIEKRDNGVRCNWENIFMFGGASKGIEFFIRDPDFDLIEKTIVSQGEKMRDPSPE